MAFFRGAFFWVGFLVLWWLIVVVFQCQMNCQMFSEAWGRMRLGFLCSLFARYTGSGSEARWGRNMDKLRVCGGARKFIYLYIKDGKLSKDQTEVIESHICWGKTTKQMWLECQISASKLYQLLGLFPSETNN